MKIDLHVHSKYSTRPSQWVLQKLGCHECYTEPQQLYRIAKQRGMDWITITDHNNINGCLEIAHLPDTFISEEVTSYFPEDGCKIHVLVYDIDQSRHGEIQKLRENVSSLVAYLQQEKIAHSLAHPLWSVNGRLSLDHFEKLLLLFKTFEINGSRDEQLNLTLRRILSHLTPKCYEQLIDKHGIIPGFSEPWRKNFTGGSDDHSSLTICRIHTEVPHAANLKDFFTGLQNRQARIIGRASSPQTLAHNIYSIAYQFYAHKLGLHDHSRYDTFIGFLDKALRNAAAPKRSRFNLFSLSFFLKKGANGNGKHPSFSFLELVKDEIQKFIQNEPVLKKIFRQIQSAAHSDEKQWFAFVKELSDKILIKFNQRLDEGVRGAHFIDLFQSLTVIGIIYLLLLPYVAAFNSFAQDRHLSEEILARFMDMRISGKDQPQTKIAHFSDTYYEINGVALTLQKQANEAQLSHKPYTVITCDVTGHENSRCVQNFTPLAVWDLPEYQEQKLFHPPLLEILNYCYDQKFTRVLAATPGPMGLAALLIARILDLPIDGTYHTSLPQYAHYLTEDSSVEDLMWRYILWFYNQMQNIYSPSVSTAAELAERGISAEKICTFPRGVDLQRFHPRKRDGLLETRYHLQKGLKLLYVGRISKEKNLQVLVRAFKRVIQVRPEVHLIVVGDGPYFEEMQLSLSGTPCLFTGYLDGEELASVYASCDLFLFPSTTDTFGNVVLEAQASGLPVIVTDAGGPQENIVPGKTGLVVRGDDEAAFAEAILRLIADPKKMQRMGKEARVYIENRSFKHAFNATWQLYREEAERLCA
ncbi:glycosyltransferase [Desulfobacca acetoxidans]|uniref:Glycosyl transferase group 1 n=1 Tax=Desulfobacca acetoxidans (strain ATCC 700848 / DSM 11109 / ASRB2) TaxID=880072 RepID=F2NC14_DESAR|nr:glycosyltransferase [Desulfobacca acetoxidans]AEB08091.1 glycosyl transferase group 1 [Desulfobacca acetoxidans DSM 11109]